MKNTTPTLLDELDAAVPRRAVFHLVGAVRAEAIAARETIASGRHTRTTLARVLKARHKLTVSEKTIIRALKEIGI